MNANQLRNIGTVSLFVTILLSGYWLSRSGKPYSGLVLTIHKLIAVGTAVLLAVAIIRSGRAGALGTAELITGVVSSVFFLSLVVTGGLLSSELQTPAVVSRVHQVAPYLTILSTIATLFLVQS
ncbi:MAG: hypothetical protein PVI59_15175 [Anaerolineae bacterium]|jgi:uncharacterized membrane protein YGL010W